MSKFSVRRTPDYRGLLMLAFAVLTVILMFTSLRKFIFLLLLMGAFVWLWRWFAMRNDWMVVFDEQEQTVSRVSKNRETVVFSLADFSAVGVVASYRAWLRFPIFVALIPKDKNQEVLIVNVFYCFHADLKRMEQTGKLHKQPPLQLAEKIARKTGLKNLGFLGLLLEHNSATLTALSIKKLLQNKEK